ncbi:MAG TPA: solute carrier family 23 protein [Candidatus Thermoplasmatota archaeon]|nr:solute carrier family 23 protein [Candidatus Thermoplasmatota archaeon]
MADADLVYAPDEKPRSAFDWGLYSLQWVVTMFYAVVWGYAIVGLGLGFEGAEFSAYMSAIVLTIGVGTLAQALAGHRFAMVSGPNIIPSLAIVAALAAGGREYALQAFTAQAITGIAVAALGLVGVLGLVRKVWSPLVLGSMVLTVGLAIAGVGLEQLAALGFGWPFAFGLALAVGGAALSIRGRGLAATLAPLLIIGLGYLVFAATGALDWSLSAAAPTFVLPALFPYGLAMPPLDLLAVMLVVNLMAALNLFGNLRGYADVVGEEVPPRRERRSFAILGAVETGLAGVLGVPATVAYGENLGIVLLTRVAARAFIIVAAVVFILLAFLGPVGGFLAAMPGPIAGAVLLGVASTVIGIGASMMADAPEFGRREQTLVGFSVFLALGLYLLPEGAWSGVPTLVTTVLSNPVISVILFVIVMEQVILRKTKPRRSTPRQESGAPDRPARGDRGTTAR